jgi:hypothetical protein
MLLELRECRGDSAQVRDCGRASKRICCASGFDRKLLHFAVIKGSRQGRTLIDLLPVLDGGSRQEMEECIISC